MASSERTQPLQDVFDWRRDEWQGVECDCAVRLFTGLEKVLPPLLCNDAPWLCPKKEAARLRRNPGACNTGVSLGNLDHPKSR